MSDIQQVRDLQQTLELKPIIRLACSCGHDAHTLREKVAYMLKTWVPRPLRRTRWFRKWYYQPDDLAEARRQADEVMRLFKGNGE